jgi:CRISPR-associated protein Csb2
LTIAQKRVLALLPPRLIDALRAETGDLRATGWNLPPGARMITYERPGSAVTSSMRIRHEASAPAHVTTARIALAGRPLPRIEDSVRIGEAVRATAIRIADSASGAAGVPSEISGHGPSAEDNHRHAFYLPEDADGDGHIDHVLVHAPGGLSPAAVTALGYIRRLWIEDGVEWTVVFEGVWTEAPASGSVYGARADRWRSVTPYLHPWFAKRRFGVEEQIRKECAQRELPAPDFIRIMPSVPVRGRERRPVHFHRFRSKRWLRQPDVHGSMIEIAFPRSVAGPLALGFGCHYGLGMLSPNSA